MACSCTVTVCDPEQEGTHDNRSQFSDDMKVAIRSMEAELRSQRVEECMDAKCEGRHQEHCRAAPQQCLGTEDHDLLLAFKGLGLSSSHVGGISITARKAEGCGELPYPEDSLSLIHI